MEGAWSLEDCSSMAGIAPKISEGVTQVLDHSL
jgi:hypothetical protein